MCRPDGRHVFFKGKVQMITYLLICDENEENNLSQQIVESGVKSRKISIFKEFLRHDKNIICLPRQGFEYSYRWR